MPSLCLYFQIHQPYRIRHNLSYRNIKTDIFDEERNAEIMRRVAHTCYVPALKVLLGIVKTYGEAFKCALSVTGSAVEQMEAYAPEALVHLRRLVDTGSVELLAETYYHSLSSLIEDDTEFERQVEMHQAMMKRMFGYSPSVFRNTELIYTDRIGERIAKLGFCGVLVEGIDQLFSSYSSSGLYRAKEAELGVIPRVCSLSDDIAFRFSSSGSGQNLTAKSYLQALEQHAQWGSETCLVGVDFETFGEHHKESSGILQFLEQLPNELLTRSSWSFAKPSEITVRRDAKPEIYSSPTLTSWADSSKDTSTWLGNRMQKRAFECLYSGTLRTKVGDEVWGRLQASDHLYYMSTKQGADGDVHRYFRPFDTPYEAFISFMNCVESPSPMQDRQEVGDARSNASSAQL